MAPAYNYAKAGASAGSFTAFISAATRVLIALAKLPFVLPLRFLCGT